MLRFEKDGVEGQRLRGQGGMQGCVTGDAGTQGI